MKSLLLLLALALTAFLPVAAATLVHHFDDELSRRASATPLVAGGKGDRFDLVLKSLYFTGGAPEPITMADFDELADTGRALAIPLHLEFSAGGAPLVATTPDYYRFRKLEPARGTLPLLAGDVALGGSAARRLGLGVGDTLPSDQVNLYDLSATYPLRMRVVGVLAEAGTPDDEAAFASLETAWVIAGFGHGHDKLGADSPAADVLGRGDGRVTASAALEQFIEITAENIGDFHFHGDRAALPVNALIAVPNSPKDRTLLKGRYSTAPDLQMLVPGEVVGELLGIVFKIKRLFDATFGLVALAAALFLALVVLLSLRLRKRERETLFLIGCSRGTVAWMQVAEILILAAGALLVAAAATSVLLWQAPNFTRSLLR